MVYYVKNKDKIEKYQIDIDKKKLAKLEDEIIEKGSKAEHKIAECTENVFYGYTSIKIIKNVKRVKKIDKTIDGVPVYRYEYDELSSPLLDIVYDLYHEKTDAIDEIYGYDGQLEDVRKQIDIIDKELFDTCDTDKFNELCAYMVDLVRKEKLLNRDMVYIKKIKELLIIRLLDTMDKKDVKKAAIFLETEKPKYGKAKIKVR